MLSAHSLHGVIAHVHVQFCYLHSENPASLSNICYVLSNLPFSRQAGRTYYTIVKVISMHIGSFDLGWVCVSLCDQLHVPRNGYGLEVKCGKMATMER